jgi:hypothetical protein
MSSSYFTIVATLSPPPPPNLTVDVEVNSQNGFKGTVDLSFWCDGDAPTYIDPTSASVYVPKDGSASTTVSVGMAAGTSATFHADGSSGNLSAEGTTEVAG